MASGVRVGDDDSTTTKEETTVDPSGVGEVNGEAASAPPSPPPTLAALQEEEEMASSVRVGDEDLTTTKEETTVDPSGVGEANGETASATPLAPPPPTLAALQEEEMASGVRVADEDSTTTKEENTVDPSGVGEANGEAASATPLAPPPPPPTLAALQEEEVEAVEEILGYRFGDRMLAAEALTHVSYYCPAKPGPSYERLEYMGDAVINCLVARELFTTHPELSPGPLTRLRAANADNEKLARVAVAWGLHRFLRHKAPQLDGQIEDFLEAIVEYPVHSNGLLETPKVLADIVESLLGAVFMDTNSSLEIVWEVFKQLSGPLIGPKMLGKHPVSELNELCQKRRMQLRFLKDTWPESMAVEVLVDGNLVGKGTYRNKKEIAQNRAAKAALENLKVSTFVETAPTKCHLH